MSKQKISTKPPSGMRDFLGPDVARRRHVVRLVQQTYERYGFEPLETPTIENLSTLLGKYGEEGDQLMYRILRRGEALGRALESGTPTEADLSDLGLRYDLTVPLARVVANYPVPRFYKRYQIQPVWRAERAAKGRYREFYQCDVDITGTTSLTAEAEVCGAVADALHALGFADFTLQVNHRGLLRALISTCGIDLSQESTTLVALDKLDKIGREGVLAELRNRGIADASAARLLEILQGVPPESAARLPYLRERLGEAGEAPLADLEEMLTLGASTPAGPHLQCAPALARGLSYYTGCIFEIVAEGVKGSLGGGGRYDGLVGMFGKQEVPAVGFSLGLERILLLMDERNMYPPLPLGPQVYLCSLDVAPATVLAAAAALRRSGLRVDVYPQPAKLKRQLQYASESAHALAAGILGSEEAAAESITLKHLASGEQVTVRWSEAATQIQGWEEARAP